MRCAYVGNYKAPHSTENDVAKTLESLGHQVCRIQEDETDWAQRVHIAEGFAAEIFLWTCTWHSDFRGGFEALHALREKQITSISFHLDLYLGLARENEMAGDPFWRTDLVFTADGGHDLVFAARGINHHWLRPGVFDQECVTGKFRPEWEADVAFIGSYRNYHREWTYRRDLIEWLQTKYGTRYRHFGGGVGPPVRGTDLADAIASSKVIIGDSLCLKFSHPRYWSDRVYETLGRGGFLIHPFIEGLDDEFTDGKHLVFYRYGDFEQLHELIDYYVSHDDERREIASEGQRFVQQNATYAHRMREMLSVYRGSPQGLRRVRDMIRARVTDADVLDEIFSENVYRVRPEHVRDGTVVDLGANIGAFSVLCDAMGASKVIAVEPQVENVALLERNASSPRIHLVPMAVTGDGRRISIVGEGGGAHTEDGPEPSATLDQVFGMFEVSRCAFLKMDIEGDEYGIIAGTEVLDRVERIAIEFHSRPMLGGREPAGSFGEMVSKLAEHFAIDIIGKPSTGGMIYGHAH